VVIGILRIKVILVDDETNLLEVSKHLLERDARISVETASSAVLALKMIELNDYDVVVSDYQMPGMDGIQLLKELRRAKNRIPFILFTGRGREEVVIEALNNGADFYLQKGGEIESQFAELANMIKQAHSKKEGELTLLISEERYRSLFQNSVDAVILSTIEGEIISANPSACLMFGMNEEELKSTNIQDNMVLGNKWKTILQKGKRTGMINSELTFVRKNGTTFIGDTNLGCFTGPDNHARISIIVRDGTERQRKVEALKISEERYRRLFETAQDGILILDFESEKIVDANKFILDLTGYMLDDLVGRSLWELGFMRDKALAEEAFSQLRTDGYVRYEDIPLRRKNGEILPVEFISNVYMVKETKIVQCNIRDISERALRDAKIKELAHIVDSTAVGVIGKDLKGMITSWNKGAEVIYGYAQEDMLGRSILILATPDSRDDMETILAKISQGDVVTHFETTHLRKDGGEINVSLTESAVRDNRGIIIGSSTIATDTTERKSLDTALLEAKKKLNLLSSITRHDINNQLMALLGNLELLERNSPETSSNAHLLQVKAAAKRISATIEFTKTYEDIGVQEPVWHDVRTLVATATKDVLIGNVKVLNDCPSGIEVFADPLILKVFTNLIDNAIQHGTGVSTIRFYLQLRGDERSIVCEDDGAGIEPAMKDKLFTRGVGKNHGLGLFLSREIVSITGITLTEEGLPGHGARFIMTIPRGGVRGKKGQS
jgi:PAS domain S-box-containing protein